MEKELADIKNFCERLRADLAATQSALAAVFAALPQIHRDRSLQLLAMHSARRADSAERSPTPADTALREIQDSEERLYRLLQEASHRQASQGL